VLYYEGVTLSPKKGVKKQRSEGKPEAERRVRITEKDPSLMCGKGTSVERVFRVEENLEKSRNLHLVFFDRHGWYCEHGAQCQAVSDVRKFIRHSR
jgi:hypothetical protein